ncbi:phosphorylase family protein [Microbispora bryophytorum]|uniref:5'-methylthioadenosine/S-adenosylhomocysteine nucleosidase family protein n=1 Tax=Microbispora bryophytorum TaxID=1460882 RepID=UPI003406AE80
MTGQFKNSGIINQGGPMTISGTAIGDGATVVHHHPTEATARRRANVGVITIKESEARAVIDTLKLERAPVNGIPFWHGTINLRGVATRVAMTRSLSQGQRSTMAAFENLREAFRPAVIALVGIGGGFQPDISTGDVAIATRAVYYDLRKETADGTQRRGEDRETSAIVGNAVNSFFVDYGEPAHFVKGEDEFHVISCIIGTGDAVIADAESEIRKYLKHYNDKISVVDMEAGGLAQAFHERGSLAQMHGWVVIRGVSDYSNKEKNDVLQKRAARNAAEVLRVLIPYLPSHT